jgi:hypothetical protein
VAQSKEDGTVPDYYELRRFQLRNGPMGKRLDEFLAHRAVPALNLYGVQPVGVFTGVLGDTNPVVYALLRHTSLESIVAVRAWLAADQEFQRAGAHYFDVPATDPSYVRAESWLLVAFDGMLEIELPPGAGTTAPRLFELRRYESHSEAALRRKIEMFNTREIAIFRRTGLRPVFFGETLIGSRLPNLTYLLAFEDMAARADSWATFRADPEWKQLWSTPGLTDAEIVSNVTSVILRPAPYSQI